MIYISKNNKQKTKWNKRNFFKRKKSSRRQVGHPVLVYAEANDNYKYLTFTHSPEKGKENDYEKLKHNIDPKKDGLEPTYVKKKSGFGHSKNFDPPQEKYRIHNDDKTTVKKYKK